MSMTHPSVAENQQALPTPVERLLHWEKHSPQQVYFTQPTGDGQIREYTWGQIAHEVRCMAAYLSSLELPPQSKIAIISKNCAHWIMSDLAIWMAGHISVPLYPTLTADAVSHILEHSESKAVFVGKLDNWPDMQSGVPEHLHCISYPLSPPTDFISWEQIVQQTSPMAEPYQNQLDDLATIIYTSGTTGLPKGVMHNFAGLAYAATKIAELNTLTQNDRALSYLPLSHVAERMAVEIASLYYGFKVFFAESLETFSADIQRTHPTVFFGVPRIWDRFQAGVFSKLPEAKLNRLLSIPLLGKFMRKKVLQGLGLDQVHTAISGAAPIPHALLHWYQKLGLEIQEGYGMTENLGYSHYSRAGQARVGYVGEPNPGTDVKLSDIGEVLVKNPCTMLGYYKEPEKTAETLTDDGYLRTGDIGEIDDKKRLKITGRAKEIFKTQKGKYVAPAPIENKLLAHSAVELACVTGTVLPQPIVMIVLDESLRGNINDADIRQSTEQQLQTLLETVNPQLDPHERLKTLVILREGWSIENNMLTPTLKVKRNIVEAHYQDHFQSWYDASKPVVWE